MSEYCSDTTLPPRKRHRYRTDISFLLNEEEIYPKRARMSPPISSNLKTSSDPQPTTSASLPNIPTSNNNPLQPSPTIVTNTVRATQSPTPRTQALELERTRPYRTQPQPQQRMTDTPEESSSNSQSSANSSNTSAPNRQSRTVTNKVPCDECGVSFCNEQAVKRHKRRNHPSEDWTPNEVACPDCKLTLKSEQNLIRHARTHGPGATFKCSECEASFLRGRGLTIHMRDQHGRTQAQRRSSNVSFMCPFEGCNYASAQKTNVTRHRDGVHLGIRNFICPVCSHRSSTKANMEAHENTHKKEGDKEKRGKGAGGTDRNGEGETG